MLARCCSASLFGLEAVPVLVEVDLAPGLPGLQLVGLPDAAVQESRERVRAALRNGGFAPPLVRVIVNLAPADLRKEGPCFDLPIALALLVASGQLGADLLDGLWCAGELGLDGSVRPVRGVLALALTARRQGARRLLVPRANAAEAELVEGLAVVAADDLRTLTSDLALAPSDLAPRSRAASPPPPRREGEESDLADVIGQEMGRRGLEIAAAGGHHMLLVGPPGCGKTMLARRLAGLLPPLGRDEALEISRIHSVAGMLSAEATLLRRRPFRAPHHSVTAAALLGGGAVPRPGELTLAHGGVLFLDELTEFRRSLLDQLRQPLEEGWLTVCRARHRLRWPCRLALIAATNPCPCGWFGDGSRICRCGEHQRRRYWSRLSGPLLDRIDLQVVLRRQSVAPLLGSGEDDPTTPLRGRETTAQVAQRVEQARERMRHRNPGGLPNAHVDQRSLQKVLQATAEAADLWQRSIAGRDLSGRAAARVLRVARTIADLGASSALTATHLAEALTFRSFDTQAAPADPATQALRGRSR